MKYIFGNWKMNLGIRESIALSRAVMRIIRGEEKTPVVTIFPSFTVLNDVRKIMARSRVKLGAQNCATDKKGAFTGEISCSMLEDVGCDYVLVGHSERRNVFNENNELVAKRYKSAIESRLTPILCVGEPKNEREAGNAQGYVSEQLLSALKDLKIPKQKDLFVAYEPIWAIGSNRSALVSDMVFMHDMIRSLVVSITDHQENKVHILYGGSVDSKNAYSFLREAQVDGVLVGGASLKIREFEGIVQSAIEVMTAQEL